MSDVSQLKPTELPEEVIERAFKFLEHVQFIEQKTWADIEGLIHGWLAEAAGGLQRKRSAERLVRALAELQGSLEEMYCGDDVRE